MSRNTVHGIRFSSAAGLVVLFVAGCGTSPTPSADSAPAGKQIVTFYVKEMSERLNLTWSEWPNRVKQALEGLEGVELVEDEYDREILAEEPTDLLYVTYDSDVVTVENMLETIGKQKFQGELR